MTREAQDPLVGTTWRFKIEFDATVFGAAPNEPNIDRSLCRRCAFDR